MFYDVLKRLASDGKLNACLISIFMEEMLHRMEIIMGSDVKGVKRSGIVFSGDETGYEEFSVPLERVLEIELNGKVVFKKKKKRITRIYPRF
jgi:uncharacterized protein (UPF0248 family)